MKKKKKQSLVQLLKKAEAQRITTAFVAFVVVGSVAYFGTLLNQPSKAQPPPGQMYLAPPSGSHTPGETFSVEIRENTGNEAVNTVQAALVYNSAQVQIVALDEGTAFPFAAATDTSSPGLLRIARGVNAGQEPVKGDNLVVKVTFQVVATSGVASLSFDEDQSMIMRSLDNVNIMAKGLGSSFSVKYPSSTVQ